AGIVIRRDNQSFAKRWQMLKADLESLDEELTTANAAYHDEPLLASHPVFDYLARRCHWNLKSLHWEPDEIPSEEQWLEMQRLLETHAAEWMVWEAEPLPDVKQRLAAINVRCIVFSPCGNVPQSGDYLQVMRENIQRVQQCFHLP
ncbi:MAG: zinc ABC transporter substrate-binding protein, partial [Planctomycetes bacterium]|nr:zinc ABC transporter substrate-binding protein [Planctomycetota bacterium]